MDSDQQSLSNILQRLVNSPDNHTDFDNTWTQGRSAFGGLSAAFAVTAMRKALGSALPLRSLMVSFIAPLPPGTVQVQSRILRQGRNVTQMSAEVLSDGQVCLQALAAFGVARDELQVVAPQIKPESRDSGLNIAEHRKRMPEFLQYFEGAWLGEGLPFSGKRSNTLNMWVKHQAGMGEFADEKLVTIADIPPPVVLSYFDTPPVPASSLTWSLEFVQPAERIDSDWFYLQFTAEAAAEGYTQQSGRIYSESGELCALSRQCMVYFGNRDAT
jgi:acyl-CoA thioesterase